jgi:UDP-N-acetylglucosamine 2-epimerase
MEEYFIKSALDWPRVEKLLIKRFDRTPEFKHDVKKICENIHTLVEEASKQDVLFRQTHRRYYQEKSQDYINQANAFINKNLKIYLFVELSR